MKIEKNFENDVKKAAKKAMKASANFNNNMKKGLCCAKDKIKDIKARLDVETDKLINKHE